MYKKIPGMYQYDTLSVVFVLTELTYVRDFTQFLPEDLASYRALSILSNNAVASSLSVTSVTPILQVMWSIALKDSDATLLLKCSASSFISYKSVS